HGIMLPNIMSGQLIEKVCIALAEHAGNRTVDTGGVLLHDRAIRSLHICFVGFVGSWIERSRLPPLLSGSGLQFSKLLTRHANTEFPDKNFLQIFCAVQIAAG